MAANAGFQEVKVQCRLVIFIFIEMRRKCFNSTSFLLLSAGHLSACLLIQLVLITIMKSF